MSETCSIGPDGSPAPVSVVEPGPIRWTGRASISALGSYSYIPVGGSGEDKRVLGSAASETLHFAGEHTVPDSSGTVHAASMSGQRAAAGVLARLTGRG